MNESLAGRNVEQIDNAEPERNEIDRKHIDVVNRNQNSESERKQAGRGLSCVQNGSLEMAVRHHPAVGPNYEHWHILKSNRETEINRGAGEF